MGYLYVRFCSSVSSLAVSSVVINASLVSRGVLWGTFTFSRLLSRSDLQARVPCARGESKKPRRRHHRGVTIRTITRDVALDSYSKNSCNNNINSAVLAR